MSLARITIVFAAAALRAVAAAPPLCPMEESSGPSSESSLMQISRSLASSVAAQNSQFSPMAALLGINASVHLEGGIGAPDSSIAKVLLAQLENTANNSLGLGVKIDNASKEVLRNLTSKIQEGMLSDLISEMNSNQASLNDALQNILDCKTTLDTDLKDLSLVEANVTVKKGQHSECRRSEADTCSDSQRNCDDLSGWLDGLKPCVENRVPGKDTREDKAVMVVFFTDMKDWAVEHLEEYLRLEQKCTGSSGNCTDSTGQCEVLQEKFEINYCKWVTRWTRYCTSYHGDYDINKKAFISFNGTVAERQLHSKIEYQALKRMVCLIDVILADKKSVEERRDDMIDCNTKDYNTEALNIVYPIVPEAETCDPYDGPTPGQNDWYRQEYTQMNITYADTAQIMEDIECGSGALNQPGR